MIDKYRVKVYLETRIIFQEVDNKAQGTEMAFEIMRSRVFWWEDLNGVYHYHPVRKVKLEKV